MKSIQKPIVIVGAGFAGMTFALNLKNLNPSLPILVVDSETNFIFKPLMYEVLSKEIRSWEATPKFANIFSDAGITFLRNCLTKISFHENILEWASEEFWIPYKDPTTNRVRRYFPDFFIKYNIILLIMKLSLFKKDF